MYHSVYWFAHVNVKTCAYGTICRVTYKVTYKPLEVPTSGYSGSAHESKTCHGFVLTYFYLGMCPGFE